LACHALEQWRARETWQLKIHGYRAMLQLLLHQHGIRDVPQLGRLRVRLAESDSFVTYATKILSKLSSNVPMPTEAEVQHIQDLCGHTVASTGCIYALRLLLGRLAESVVLLDRLEWLSGVEGVVDARIVPLFDPKESPRNLALVGTRRR